MAVAVLYLEIHLPGAHSLKEKRAVVRSLKDRLRARFNLSVAELDHQDLWQRARVGLAAIGPDRSYLEGLLSRAEREATSCLAGQELAWSEIEIWEDAL